MTHFIARRSAALAAVVIALGALGGCLNYVMVPPAPATIGDAYTVTPTVAWNKSSRNNDERWTIDGNTLQEMIFVSIGDGKQIMSLPLGGPTLGDPLMPPAQSELPVYRATMTPLDVKELVEANVVKLGAADFKTTGFQPAKFGPADGFRFDFTFSRKNGLQQKGFVVATQAGGRLNLILFSAAAVYYYDRYGPEAERIVASIQFPKA